MVEMQKRIAKIIKLRREKVVAKLKDSRSDLLYDLAGFCGDEFEMALGKGYEIVDAYKIRFKDHDKKHVLWAFAYQGS